MTIRVTLARALAAVAALVAAGLLVAWSGVIGVAASSGHWPITDVLLHWAMRSSVRTHAAFETPAVVRDDGGLVSAAGHFAGACVMCHGGPGVAPAPVMQQATPPAPSLLRESGKWTDRQLFWILRHGVKYTGMPAWAAQGRDDEVRRMVGFVRRLPGMTPATYQALSGTARGLGCASCHGEDGRGRGQPDIPVLGGQDPAYLLAALDAYAEGRRESAVMAQAAAALPHDVRRSLAAWFAARPGLGAAPLDDPAAARLVTRGLPAAQLPACTSCHRPGGRAPVIAGQKAAYIAARLRRWRGDPAVVDARKPQATMPVIARRIPEAMIDPLARYLAGSAASRVSSAAGGAVSSDQPAGR